MTDVEWRQIGIFSAIALVMSLFDMSLARRLVLTVIAAGLVVSAGPIAKIVRDWT